MRSNANDRPSARAYGEAGMLARLTGQARTTALLNDALLNSPRGRDGLRSRHRQYQGFVWFDQLLPGSGLILYG